MALLEVFLAVGCGDFLRNSLQCHLREIERVGTHVGDESVLVKLLGNHHSLGNGHSELARGFLLERGSGERRCRRLFQRMYINAGDRVGCVSAALE